MQIMVIMLVMAVSCANGMDEEIKKSPCAKDEQHMDAQDQNEIAKLKKLMQFQAGDHKGKWPIYVTLSSELVGITSALYSMKLIYNDGYWEETTACLVPSDKQTSTRCTSFHTSSTQGRTHLSSEQANFNVVTISQLCKKQQENGKKLDTVEACLRSIAGQDSSTLSNLGTRLYRKFFTVDKK